MSQRINLDGVEYETSSLTDNGKSILVSLQEASARLQELQNLQAIFTRAKRSYIDELKREIIKGKSGVDIAALFD
ncbi:hypothetical protein [Lentibacter sp.]|jgi:hypothetical protein|uniref:hypothetical protein n=1 Tax=Lentibacter sp. TaxID=2024994 RepID=UPI003F6A0BF2